jgi:hypothetical protein
MSSPYPNRDPEVQQMIEVILRALAKTEAPTMVVEPWDDLNDSRSAFAQLCLAETTIDPAQRRN